MDDFSDSDKRFVNLAATLLDDIGRRADAPNTLPALYCLAAAEHLARVGARVALPSQAVHTSPDVRGTLQQVLRILALLPDRVFRIPDVVAATDTALLAYQASV